MAKHTSKAIKLFIKLVVKDEVLYRSFKDVRSQSGDIATPLILEEVRKVARK